MYIDTHCHIHDSSYYFDANSVLSKAKNNGVEKVICIGTNVPDSRLAVRLASEHPNVYAAVGVHPHDVTGGFGIDQLVHSNKVVAVGEIGLDYYYLNSPKDMQQNALEYQMDIALKAGLPIVFHVRDAFDDFWRIYDNMIHSSSSFKGVIHSFSDSQENLDSALSRGLFIGLNGISTFTKDASQRAMFANIPLDHLVLETDAPFLTPVPFRGTINEPAYIPVIAEFFAKLSNNTIDKIAEASTSNAKYLFEI